MAYLSCDTTFGPITLPSGIELSAAADEDFTVPDDLADEAKTVIERTPGRSVTIKGYHTPLDLWVGPVSPWDQRDILTDSASAIYLNSFQVYNKQTVGKAYLEIGVSSGSVCIGIYTQTDADTLTRICTTGSIAAGTGSTMNSYTLTPEVTLYPGVVYYAAYCPNNATVTSRTSSANGGIQTADIADFPNGRIAPHINPGTFPLPTTIDISDASGTGKNHAIYFAPA